MQAKGYEFESHYLHQRLTMINIIGIQNDNIFWHARYDPWKLEVIQSGPAFDDDDFSKLVLDTFKQQNLKRCNLEMGTPLDGMMNDIFKRRLKVNIPDCGTQGD